MCKRMSYLKLDNNKGEVTTRCHFFNNQRGRIIHPTTFIANNSLAILSASLLIYTLFLDFKFKDLLDSSSFESSRIERLDEVKQDIIIISSINTSLSFVNLIISSIQNHLINLSKLNNLLHDEDTPLMLHKRKCYVKPIITVCNILTMMAAVGLLITVLIYNDNISNNNENSTVSTFDSSSVPTFNDTTTNPENTNENARNLFLQFLNITLTVSSICLTLFNDTAIFTKKHHISGP